MMPEDYPPKYYVSGQDFGPRLRLPNPKFSYSLNPKDIPVDIVEIVEYEKVEYRPQYPWTKTESLREYRKREMRAWLKKRFFIPPRKDIDRMRDLLNSQYPATAMIVVTIAPAWIYKKRD
jgi:hypothetical protein